MQTPPGPVSPASLEDPPGLPLVLLPGTLCDDRVFAPMLSFLQVHLPNAPIQVLPVDRCDTMALTVEHVLRRAPGHFALLGFSLGGIVALQVAIHAPGRVRRLALLDSTALPVPVAHHAGRRALVAEAQQRGLRSYVEQDLWPQYVAADSQGNILLREQICSMAESLGVEVLRRQTELALNRADARPLLPLITAPVLIVAGEEDRLCPPEGQRALAALLPDATLVLIPAAGHFAIMEKPDVVAAHVAAWSMQVCRAEAAAQVD